MSSSFALIVTFINLILWILFFIAFKRRFSPKHILDTIKDEVDKLLIVMNQETDRDLTLLEAKLSEIHESLKYADYVLQQVKSEEKLASPDYGQRIEMHQEEPAVTVSISDEAKSGKGSWKNEAVVWEQNMELFTGYAVPQQRIPEAETGQPESDGSLAAPVTSPVQEDSTPRKVNRQQIIDLWQMGQSVSEIARRLDVDMTSVQMIIDMFS